MQLVAGISKAVIVIISSLALVEAAASWGFIDGTVSVQSKGSGVGNSHKEKYAFRGI